MHNAARLLHSPGEATITPATREDITLIRSLAQRIWPECFAGIIAPEKISNMLEKIYAPESLAGQMEQGQQFWIAALNGEPVGFASGFKTDDTVWVKKLYLDKAARGKAFGRQLLEHVIAAFQPARYARLYVYSGNINAQVFYERAGFAFSREEEVTMGDYRFIDRIYEKELQ